MSIASEFSEMAIEMLDDPEIGYDGILRNANKVKDPNAPWKITTQPVDHAVRLFYDTQKRGTVNGSLIQSGEKVFIAYEPEGVNLEKCIGWDFVDHTGRTWNVNAVEAVGAGNETVICYVKIGS